jgi:signal peptide peptidase SppA
MPSELGHFREGVAEAMRAGAFGEIEPHATVMALDRVGLARWQSQVESDLAGVLAANAHRLGKHLDIVAALDSLLSDRYWKREDFVVEGGVGIFAINGPIQKGEDFYTRYGYAVSARKIASTAGTLAADSAVKSVLTYMDSPGGTVDGTSEAGDAMFATRQSKPLIVHVSGNATSAAQWLSAQASATLVEPSALMGSIGVRMSLLDVSKAMADRGVVVNTLTTGTFKDAGSPYKPLSEEEKTYLLGLMQGSLNQFSAALIRGRGISAEAVALLAKDAALLSAQQAIDAGLADEISPSFAYTLALMGKKGRKK